MRLPHAGATLLLRRFGSATGGGLLKRVNSSVARVDIDLSVSIETV
jgi:hypothetical protein